MTSRMSGTSDPMRAWVATAFEQLEKGGVPGKLVVRVGPPGGRA